MPWPLRRHPRHGTGRLATDSLGEMAHAGLPRSGDEPRRAPPRLNLWRVRVPWSHMPAVSPSGGICLRSSAKASPDIQDGVPELPRTPGRQARRHTHEREGLRCPDDRIMMWHPCQIPYRPVLDPGESVLFFLRDNHVFWDTRSQGHLIGGRLSIGDYESPISVCPANPSSLPWQHISPPFSLTPQS